MKQSQILRAEQDKLREQAKAINAAAKNESRELTAEEGAQLDAVLDNIDSLDAQISESVKAEAADRQARLERAQEVKTAAKPSVVEVGKNRIEDSPNYGFASAGEFYQKAWLSFTSPGSVAGDDRLRLLAATGMNQSTGSEGGIMVPPAYSQTIWDGLTVASDNLLSDCDVYTIPAGVDSLTFPAIDETSRAAGSRMGGVRGYWIAEAAQMTSSKPKLRQMKLEPKELAVLVYVTDKLLRNGAAVEQFVTRAATEEIAFMVGDAVINGDGAGKPLGILSSGALVSVAKETNQVADTIVGENLVKAFGRLHTRSKANAVWLVNQEVVGELTGLFKAIGAGGQLLYMPPGGISQAPYGTIFGRPVREVEYAAKLGDAGDVILADLKSYAVGIRGGVRTDMSIHLKFDYAETAFRFLFEIDGQPWVNSAITPFKANSGKTVSPFVTIAERA
jgi:HK97 family phage major capsid protein